MKRPRISDILGIEEKIFTTEEELSKHLRAEGFDEKIISETILHERAHFNAARERGYIPTYGFMKIGIVGFGTMQVAFVNFDREIRPEDKEAIYLAPKNPSNHDRFNAERFKFDGTTDSYKMELIQGN
ncbi:MAG: hypothetical protein IIA85_00225 [Nanoarchaeota archaeon]|nr:hypothetical protein [Nanoarchaeota archaeon]